MMNQMRMGTPEEQRYNSSGQGFKQAGPLGQHGYTMPFSID